MANQKMNREVLARMVEDFPDISECSTLDQMCRKYVEAIMDGRKITPDELCLIVACSKPGVIDFYESEITPSCLV